MNRLDQELSDLDRLTKGTLETNEALDSVMGSSKYRHMQKKIRVGLKKQIKEILKSSLFDDIQGAIGKATETIWTESDDLEIQDAVNKNLKPLDEEIDPALMAAFLVWVFNRGGQDFFNQQSIPYEFQLRNQQIIGRIDNHSKKLFKGLDQTTSKWVSDQIITGKKEGFSNYDISKMISGELKEVSQARAERIVRTESSLMMGEAEQTAAVRNGATTKEWVTVGDACPICQENEEKGQIGIEQNFPSGNQANPAHPNCKCTVVYFFTPFMGSVWSGQ